MADDLRAFLNNAAKKRRTIRIFISSPGDVVEEREKARRVIDKLQRHYQGVNLQPVIWEELALPATASFQETIDFLLEQQPIDIAIFVLWSRLGSPLGTAITKPDGSPYRSGTEREFDLMLNAFQQSGQKRPVILAYTREDKAGFLNSLPEDTSELEAAIAQRKLAESFIREQFHDAEGHNLRAYHTFPEPVSFAQRLHAHLRQVIEEFVSEEVIPRWLDEPYRGLKPFDISHAAIFHGRDEETCDLLGRLREQEKGGCAFVVIVGASGSGKSSLALAGVAASLTRYGYDEGVKEWRAVTFTPSLAEGDLCNGLVRTLAEQIPEIKVDEVASGLVRDAALTVKLSLAPAFEAVAGTAGGVVRLLLVLDQMEELWTNREITSEDRAQFLNVLEALARSGHITVLATLRSDFYPQAQREPAFLRMKGEHGHYDLLPPSPAALARLITEPARLAGIRFEHDDQTGRSLDEVILRDAANDPSALPLLQFTLSELYRERDIDNQLLTLAAYEELGGIEGALGRRAADVFSQIPNEAQAALPEILPLLVTIDVDGEQSAVRRRAPLDDLINTPARRDLTEGLVEARFLTTDRQGETSVISLAHEALLRRWGQISGWINNNREHLRLRARVEQSQQRWDAHDQDPSLLLQAGLPLEEGKKILKESDLLLTDSKLYIEASIASDEARKVRQRRIRHIVFSAMSVLLIVALAAFVNARVNQRTAEEAGKRADAARIKAIVEVGNAYWQRAVTARDYEHHSIKASLLFVSSAKAFDVGGKSRAFLSSMIAVSPHVVSTFKHDMAVYGALFNADGSRVLTWSRDGTTRLWDVERGQPLRTFNHDSPVNGALFNADGSRVLTWSNDKTAWLWDVERDQPLRTFDHDDTLKGALFNADGSRVLTWSNDKTAWLWDVERDQPLRTFNHDDTLKGALFNADGSRVLTWSNDKTAWLWDVERDQPLRTFNHDSPVKGALFNADGSRVLTQSWDGTARLWDVERDRLNTF